MIKTGIELGNDGAPIDPVLRPAEAARYCRLSQSTLAKRRMRGDPPDFLKIGPRIVGYRLSSLERFLADARRSSTSDGGGAD